MKFINYAEWISILARLAEIDKKIKKGTEYLSFIERIDLNVERDRLRARFWDITQGE